MKRNPITIFHDEDWSALYINGVLVYVGDTYLVWEHLEKHYGWDVRQDDAFFMPGKSKNRANVYQTLTDLHDGIAEQKRREKEERLAELQAERLELDYEIERLEELLS